jgi:hypothetical protein
MRRLDPPAVITGLVPVIHVLVEASKDVDGRNKSGHDENWQLSIKRTWQ